LENHLCLSHGLQVAGAAWRAATRIVAGVGDLVQRIGDGCTGRVLDDRAIERSSDAVYGLHHARGDEERGFLGCRFVSDLISKPLGRFLWFGRKTGGEGFLVWASKPSKLWFFGCTTKPTRGCDSVGHASRSSGLLHVKASLARVSQSALKTDGGATAGGARGTIMEVASRSN
jgi:hypothetical protein